jgi:NIMA (never in mitosis gene a)-related kinase
MDQYKRIKVVGKGTFGQAVLVQNKKDGKHYIIKQINIASMSEREKQESLNEVKVLSGLRHTNIVQYIASFTEEGKLNIVMEYAECGDIYESIKKQKGVLFSEEV